MMNKLAIVFFFSVMLETEESISAQSTSCDRGSWQFEVTGTLWYGIV